jgi:SDR family mycofactocin-dependent oxidoreductase
VSEFEGKVALITGGARGQGRSHAVALAERGVNVVIIDACADVDGVVYPMATDADLAETVALVEGRGVKCLPVKADVRDFTAMQQAAEDAVAQFGQIDFLLANAGVAALGPVATLPPHRWSANLDVNLTGVFNAFRAVLPHMIDRRSGRIVATASVAGRGGYANGNSYNASKWGVIGLVKTAAFENGAHGITVNAVCPTSVNTHMFLNDEIYRIFRPDLDEPRFDDIVEAARMMHPLGIAHIEPIDVTNAILFLLSDAARYISGEALTVSAGGIAANSA